MNIKKTYALLVMLFIGLTAWAQPAPVLIVAGQSNADGRVPVSELPADISYQYCQWSYGSGDFKTATGRFEPFSPTVARPALGDRWGFDAIVYHLLEQSLRQPFYVIKQTMGGTSIDPRCEKSTHGNYWSADTAFLAQTKSAGRGGKSLLKALTEQIDACIDQELSHLPQGYDIRVLLWHQGESDMPQADSYHDNLQQVIAYIRQHLVEKTGNQRYASLPVVCGNFAKNSRLGSPKVAAALSQLAREDKNFYVVDANDLTLQSDKLHFDAKGAEALGRRFYEKLVEIGVIRMVTWHSTDQPATYTLTKNADPVVQTALKLWSEDLRQVTGTEPVNSEKIKVKSGQNPTIRIIQLDREPSAVKQLRQQGVPVDSLLGQNDGFFIKVVDGQLLVVGNNKRGTAYGILELSRQAGVSPWVWWSNVTPEKKASLTLPETFETLQVASVEYRGIFINDEDWTLQPWSWQTYEAGAPKGRMGAKTYRRVFELLMRLRANAIWPGMHGMTTPFYMIPGAKEQADSCGIVIGTSHCEPLGRNNVGEWNVEDRGRYNYVTNGEQVRKYWTERLQEVKGIDNIYTIGMRGVHDGPMEGVKTRKEQTEWLQRVIDDQRQLLKKYTSKNVEQIPQQFVPYKEVLGVMENGLQVPDDVMLTWCDDNYGYMTRLSDAEQQQRSGGGGVYYHLSYWGRPLDYMWLCCTQPGLIYNEMKAAYDHNVRRLWIVNVHELKVAAYPLELFLDMAWNIDGQNPSTLGLHLEQWLCREFGEQAGRQLAPAMQEFYRLTSIRRPEFMGWNQVELDKNTYPRGWSPVSDTEFSFSEFGNEADRYLDDWNRVCQTITDAEALVSQGRRDAYFSHVKYQVLGAAAMSTKMLEAQRARSIAAGNYNAARWTRSNALMAACARSMGAYQDIRQLTRYWNEGMADGQWRGTMCDSPRDLNMFYAPQLPVAPTDQETAQYRQQPRPKAASLSEIHDSSFVARNAADYTFCSPSLGEGMGPIQMLGHSMKAVSLLKGETLTYDFMTDSEGEATLYTAMIPTQPNDKGDLRYQVSLDNQDPVVISLKEKYRSEFWKTSVLRGQALKQMPVKVAKGKHTLKIKALDDHIIADQWMLDFKPGRKFYVIPVAK